MIIFGGTKPKRCAGRFCLNQKIMMLGDMFLFETFFFEGFRKNPARNLLLPGM